MSKLEKLKNTELVRITSKESLKRTLPDIRANAEIRVIILEFVNEEIFSIENGLDRELVQQIESFPIPIITLIKNKATKILFEIVLASHLCFASDAAVFEIVSKEQVKSKIGSKNTGKVSRIAKVINAETAFDLGLINRIVTAENLEKEAVALAERISKLAPLAIKSCLQAVNQGLEMNFEEGLKLETKLFSQIFTTADMKEGTRAFLEKREPHFRGK